MKNEVVMNAEAFQNSNQSTQIVSMGAKKQMVIAVASPKGGSGKTTLCKELAAVYSRPEFSNKQLKVCILDCDVEFGDIEVMLDIENHNQMADWIGDIWGRSQQGTVGWPNVLFNKNEIDRYLIKYDKNISVLLSPTSRGEGNYIPGAIMYVMINNLLNYGFDVIMLDTASNTSEYTMMALQMADKILALTSFEITAINSLEFMIKQLIQNGVDKDKINLVVNKVIGSMKQNKDKYEELCRFLEISETASFIPYDKYAYVSSNAGKPDMFSKNNKYTKSIIALAEFLNE